MTGLPSGLRVECAFTSGPDDKVLVWTDITDYVRLERGITCRRGRVDEYASVEPGDMLLTLDNTGGEFTPGNTSSPFYPHVKAGKRIRLVLDVPDFSDPADDTSVPVDTYPALYLAEDLYLSDTLYLRE